MSPDREATRPRRQATTKKRLGFGCEPQIAPTDCFAYLEGDDVDARIPSDLRHHPAFLIPRETRRTLLADLANATQKSITRLSRVMRDVAAVTAVGAPMRAAPPRKPRRESTAR